MAAVIDQVGGVLGTESIPADEQGYARLLAWLRGHGELARVGVEASGSYGARLAASWPPPECWCWRCPPDRQRRRRHGKSDAVGAVSAAAAALSVG